MPPHALSQSSSLTTEASQGGVIALTTTKITRQHDLVSFSQATACRQIREILSWIRMTRIARQDARRSGKEDAGHSLFLGGCLFGFYGEHNSKIRKGSCRDVT